MKKLILGTMLAVVPFSGFAVGNNDNQSQRPSFEQEMLAEAMKMAGLVGGTVVKSVKRSEKQKPGWEADVAVSAISAAAQLGIMIAGCVKKAQERR